MAEGGGLINIGELSKPVTTLIEKISDAVGGAIKPWQLVRVAEAEARAEIIREEAKVQISDIQRRGVERMIREEGIKQANIESITAKAIPHVKEDAKSEEIDGDWLARFFEKGRIISNPEMQQIWARILANEANTPGAFSYRTIDIVSTLSKHDAELFSQLCAFTWTIDDTQCPLIFKVRDPRNSLGGGIRFSDLMHLETLGLISLDGSGEFGLISVSDEVSAVYFDRGYKISPKINPRNSDPNTKKRVDIPIGYAAFTKAGEELFSICNATPIASHAAEVIRHWRAWGLDVVEG